MTKFTLKQFATSVPAENVDTYKVTNKDHIIFVSMPDGWVRIDLDNKTFAVGDYEG